MPSQPASQQLITNSNPRAHTFTTPSLRTGNQSHQAWNNYTRPMEMKKKGKLSETRWSGIPQLSINCSLYHSSPNLIISPNHLIIFTVIFLTENRKTDRQADMRTNRRADRRTDGRTDREIKNKKNTQISDHEYIILTIGIRHKIKTKYLSLLSTHYHGPYYTWGRCH